MNEFNTFHCFFLDRCRRQMIAIHFGEEWESSCNQMCDHCSLKAQQQSNVEMFPLFSHISAIRMILERASRQDTRLTGITRLFQQ